MIGLGGAMCRVPPNGAALCGWIQLENAAHLFISETFWFKVNLTFYFLAFISKALQGSLSVSPPSAAAAAVVVPPPPPPPPLPPPPPAVAVEDCLVRLWTVFFSAASAGGEWYHRWLRLLPLCDWFGLDVAQPLVSGAVSEQLTLTGSTVVVIQNLSGQFSCNCRASPERLLCIR